MINNEAYLLYIWYKGTDPTRPGGPWWCYNYVTEQERQESLAVFKGRLHAWSFGRGLVPDNRQWDIKPLGEIIYKDHGNPDKWGAP